MFEINKTRARWAFKDLLGQANHFLITILVGLNGIRDEKISIDAEFSTSWNPKDAVRSAARSRVFALDLALVRAIDALDTYFMLTARKPRAITDDEFVQQMDGTGRSVMRRLSVFDDVLPSLRLSHKTALEFAIEWRNRRVHSLSNDRVEKCKRTILIDDSLFIQENFSGLKVSDFLIHFENGISPTFKEAASIIHLCHEAVRHYDEAILKNLDLEPYLRDCIIEFLTTGGNLNHAISKTWGRPNSRDKIIRILRFAGVHETDNLKGRQIPESFITKITEFSQNEARIYLNNS